MTSKIRKKNVGKLLLTLFGLGLMVVGSYFLYTAMTVKKVVIQAPSAIVKASSKKRTVQQKQSYTVPPTHPRELIVKRLGIDASILPMGAPGGAMAAPASAWDVGWYEKSALPGSGKNALLIDGHVNDALGTPGVFANLTALGVGDEMQIERGDHHIVSYEVVKVRSVALNKVDMTAMLRSVEASKEGLNLITCGGVYDYKKKTYDHRILVFAVRKG
jgi:LPXTG-site transpeptidase (sortase) family protein